MLRHGTRLWKGVEEESGKEVGKWNGAHLLESVIACQAKQLQAARAICKRLQCPLYRIPTILPTEVLHWAITPMGSQLEWGCIAGSQAVFIMHVNAADTAGMVSTMSCWAVHFKAFMLHIAFTWGTAVDDSHSKGHGEMLAASQCHLESNHAGTTGFQIALSGSMLLA